jgi:hypothetical protein
MPKDAPSPFLDSDTRLNDIYKLSSHFSYDVYLGENDKSGQYVIRGTSRTYSYQRFVYQKPIDGQMSCLYTATDGNAKYAFIAWKGTDSQEQLIADIKAIFQKNREWNHFLQSVVKAFIPKLPTYLEDKSLVASDYEWFVTGHSVGGALAAATGAQLRSDPSFLQHVPIQNVITFASLKLPNDGAFANDKNNGVIEFWAENDILPEDASPKYAAHIGQYRYDIGWKVGRGNYPHAMENFRQFFEEHFVPLSKMEKRK